MLEKIKQLLINLTESDKEIANQFINERRFDDLEDLVTSAILRAKKARKNENYKGQYKDLDIDGLNSLLSYIIMYKMQTTYIYTETEHEEY